MSQFHLVVLVLIVGLYWIQLWSLFNDWGFLIRGLTWFSGALQTAVAVSRWIGAGHAPLSNLVESLQLLSWILTVAVIVVGLDLPYLTRRVDAGLLAAGVDRIPDRWMALVTNRSAMELPERTAKTGYGSYEELPPDPNARPGAYHDLFGALLMPVVLILNVFAYGLPQRFKTLTPLVPALQSNWLQMHVGVMIAAYALLLLGGLFALAYLVTNFALRRLRMASGEDRRDPHRYNRDGLPVPGDPGWVNYREDDQWFQRNPPPSVLDNFNESLDNRWWWSESLPHPVRGRGYVRYAGADANGTESYVRNEATQPPERRAQMGCALGVLAQTWDNQSYRCIGLGFPLLTLGLLSGAVWAEQTWSSYWSWDPKETWALITWLVFAVYLHTRLSRQWSGTRSALVALLGFVSLWITYLGVNLLGRGLHSYGWFS